MDENDSMVTVQLIRDGCDPVEVLASQLTPRSVATLFGLDVGSVYLKEVGGRMAYFPDSAPGNLDKVFQFNGATISSLYVEGIPIQNSPVELVVSATPSKTAGCSSRSAGSRPIFTSSKVVTKSGMNIKIVRANLTMSPEGKPNFEVKGQLFTPLTEGTATVPHLIRIITEEWGPGYTLVTKDGLKIVDSDGTRGLNFWKVGSRKFFAVMESSLAEPGPSSTKGKRKLKSMSTVRMVDDSDSTSGDDEEPRPKPKKSCTIAKELEELKDQIRNIVEVKASNTKAPIGLLITIKSAFKCTLCLSLIKPPLIFARCCKNILGCEKCITEFFQKDGLTAGLGRKCPICRADRAFNEICRVNGIDDFLTMVYPMIEGEENEDEDDLFRF